jgi:redox-sensing transcriptional repressor
MEQKSDKKVPVPTVRRLPRYLHLLKRCQANGRESISATDIANRLELESIQVRKDISYTGIVGKPRVGYAVDELVSAIEDFLGWSSRTNAVLIGVGSLGSALLGYSGFQKHGLDIVAAFDNKDEKIGMDVHGIPIFNINELEQRLEALEATIAILTLPAAVAQEVTDRIVKLGIKGIWNFSPIKISAPDDVIVQYEDLSAGLAVLSIKLGHK